MSGLLVVEIVDPSGRVTRCERMALRDGQGLLTIGRSIEADIIIDDPYVAAKHATLSFDARGQVAITDCGSTNGLVLKGKRLHGAALTPVSGDIVQIGRTRLRLRWNDDGLAAEKKDSLANLHSFAGVSGLVAVSSSLGLLLLFYAAWLGAPQDLAATFVWFSAGATVIISIWVGFWALLTRVTQGEWRLLRHSAIFLTAGVVSQVVSGAVDWVRFAFALPQGNGEGFWFGLATLCGLLYFHVTAASGLNRRRVAAFAIVLPVFIGIGHLWLSSRQSYLAVNQVAEAPPIYPPAFRLSSSRSLDSVFVDAGRLKAEAEAKKARAAAMNPEDLDR